MAHGAFPNSEDGIRNSEESPRGIGKIPPQYDHSVIPQLNNTPKADYSSNSFTIRTMPSLIRGTLKFSRRSQVQGSEVQSCFSFVNLH